MTVRDGALKQKMYEEFMKKRKDALGVEPEPTVTTVTDPVALPDLAPNHIWLHDMIGLPTTRPVQIKIYDPEDWDISVRHYIPEPITGYKYRKEFADFATVVELGFVGAIVGEPGTGKDAMALQLAALKRMPYRRIMGDRSKTQDTIIGRRTMIDGNILWESGELESVARHGGMTVLSEPFAFQADVLYAIQPMIERNGFLSMVEHPDPDQRMLKVNPNTRIVLTTNTRGYGDDQDKYSATGVMDASTLNRLEYMQVLPHLDPMIEADLIKDLVKDDTVTMSMVRFGNLMRQAWRVGEVEATWSLRNLTPWAELIQYGFNVRDAFRLTYYGKLSQDKEREAVSRCWNDCGFSINL